MLVQPTGEGHDEKGKWIQSSAHGAGNYRPECRLTTPIISIRLSSCTLRGAAPKIRSGRDSIAPPENPERSQNSNALSDSSSCLKVHGKARKGKIPIGENFNSPYGFPTSEDGAQ